MRKKAPTPLVLKRSQKYCQKDDCVFSRGEPGKPARKETDQEYCAWCDERLLAQALQAPGPEINLKVSLACFKKQKSEVYRLALERLSPESTMLIGIAFALELVACILC